jgi:hypothetical protein
MKKLLLLAMVLGLLGGYMYVTAATVWMKDGKEATATEISRDTLDCRQEGFRKKVSDINQFVKDCLKAKGYEFVEKK